MLFLQIIGTVPIILILLPNMFTKFQGLTKALTKRPFAIAIGGLFTGYGIADFNRDVSGIDLKGFTRNETSNLGVKLEALHHKAYRRHNDILKYIASNASRCEEIWFLKQKVLWYKADYDHQYLPDTYFLFVRRMCRRAMIRNGFVIKWAKALIVDEALYISSVS